VERGIYSKISQKKSSLVAGEKSKFLIIGEDGCTPLHIPLVARALTICS
jgi:hypothetical protein